MTYLTAHTPSIRPAAARLDSLWLPVAALVCGLLSAAAVFGPTHWATTSALTTAAVALGCMAVARQERGQGLAMAGVALGAAGLMGATATYLF